MSTSRRKRLGLGVVDQILSSASNMMVVFAVARVSSVSEFGSITLTFATVTGVMAAGRGFFGTPLVLLSGSPEALKREARYSNTAAAMAGVTAGLAMALVAVSLGAPNGVFILAIATPFVLVQDLSRYYCMASGVPLRAVFSDGVWAAGSLVVLAMTSVASPVPGSDEILILWSALAVLAMLMLVVPMKISPKFRGLGKWWNVRLADRFQFGADSSIGATSSLLVSIVAGSIVGSTAIAALRGAGSIMGPLNILFSAMPLILIPELSRSGVVRTVDQVWRPLRRVAFAMAFVALVVGAGSFVVPDRIGELVLGESWNVVQPILPITAFEYMSLAWLAVAQIGLKTLLRSKSVLRVRLAQSCSYLVLSLTAATVFHSAIAIAIALAISTTGAAIYAQRLMFQPAR